MKKLIPKLIECTLDVPLNIQQAFFLQAKNSNLKETADRLHLGELPRISRQEGFGPFCMNRALPA